MSDKDQTEAAEIEMEHQPNAPEPVKTEAPPEAMEAQARAVATRQDDGGKLRATSIAVSSRGVTFSSWGEIIAIARAMADSSYAVKKDFRGNPGLCIALIDYAIRFDMSPYALAGAAYVVNDALAFEAKAVAAMIIARAPLGARPSYAYEGEGDERVCICTVVTTDGEVIEHRSPPIASCRPPMGDRGRKGSPLWDSYPDQQLAYYTVRAMARLHFPDVMMGVYDVDEMRTIDHEPRERRTSGIADRIGGKAEQGFDAGHVDREMDTTINAEPAKT